MVALEDDGRFEEADALAAAAVREQLGDTLRHMAQSSADASADDGGGGGNALIIDGKALAHALKDDARDALLAVRDPSFLCCPLGKSPLRGSLTVLGLGEYLESHELTAFGISSQKATLICTLICLLAVAPTGVHRAGWAGVCGGGVLSGVSQAEGAGHCAREEHRGHHPGHRRRRQ